MKIQDEIFVGSGIDIRSKPISGLINALNTAGVPIEVEDCLKEVSYTSNRESGEARIPLNWKIGDGGYATSYILRNERLTVELSDYQEHSRGMPGMIGGSHPIGPEQIKVNIKYDGHSSTEPETAQRVLHEFYDPKPDKKLIAIVKSAISKAGVTRKPLKKRRK